MPAKAQKIKIIKSVYYAKSDEVIWTAMLESGKIATIPIRRDEYGYALNIDAVIPKDVVEKNASLMNGKEVMFVVEDLPKDNEFYSDFNNKDSEI